MCGSCRQLLTHLCARHHAEAFYIRLQFYLALSRWSLDLTMSVNLLEEVVVLGLYKKVVPKSAVSKKSWSWQPCVYIYSNNNVIIRTMVI